MTALEVVVGLVLLAGIVGTLVPVMPGSLLVALGVLFWTLSTGGALAWAVLVLVLLQLGIGAVVKYLVPGRRLQRAGVPDRTLILGGIGAIAGLFVVPLVGLPLGFVGGVYLAETARRPAGGAWGSTRAALVAVGYGIAIELASTVLATAYWLTAVVVG